MNKKPIWKINMSNFLLKILSIFLIFFIIGIIFTDNFLFTSPEKTISEYYKILEDQEKILNDEKYNASTTLEEGAKDLQTKEELVDYFKQICASHGATDRWDNDCYHGLGHAAAIQLDYNIPDSLYVCKNVVTHYLDEFNCYAGVFMEAVITLPWDKTIVKTEDGFEFPMCDILENELERQACFFESVVLFRNFVERGENKKVNFSDMTPMCKTFDDDYYRLLCIRNISLRAITENRETDLRKMCIENTSSKTERVMCVLGFSHRLALSLDPKKGAEYVKIYTDICKVLARDEALSCTSIIKQSPSKTYYLAPRDTKLYEHLFGNKKV